MQPVVPDLFTETAVVLIVAAFFCSIGAWLRQPLIVAYIATGVILGPAGFDWVQAEDTMDLLARMGVALLLFVVGLKLDPGLIRTLGKVILGLGLFQVLLTTAMGYGLAVLLGMSSITAVYVGLGLAFSSTVVIVKMLSDSREIDTLHGQIALGILIVQDLVVVVAMILLTATGSVGEDTMWQDLLLVPLKGAVLLLFVGLVMRYVFPVLFNVFTRSTELLTLVAMAWSVAVATIGHKLGFSHEVGAFIAGVSLASTPWHQAIGARLSSLRDFLLLFLFVDLGAQIDLGHLESILLPALLLSAFALIVKPLIIVFLLGRAGYHLRTAGLTALTMGQISEFSLILAALGLQIGHLDKSAVSLLTLVALITILISSYVIGFIHQVFSRLTPFLQVLETNRVPRKGADPLSRNDSPDVVVVGLGRFGKNVARSFQARGFSVLALDFDPELSRPGQRTGIPTCYGDAEDAEMVAELPLSRTKWVVSCIRDSKTNLALHHALRRLDFGGEIYLCAYHDHAAAVYLAAGIDLVLNPYQEAAEKAVDEITAPCSSTATAQP